MRVTRRSVLAGAAAAGLLPSEQALAAIGGVIPVSTGGGVSNLPATIAIVNESGSTSVAGTPTQSFGCIFNKGDIAAGTAPVFTASGVTQPFSASVASMRRFYSDGSLLFAAFCLRPTFTIAGGGTQNVTVTSGGSWPSASSRTTTEVYGAGLAVSMPAAAPSGSNLTGTWGAWLNNTTNTANLINSGGMIPVKDMDGDAGARWRISLNMSQTNGGAAHGQMVYTFYVHALNNASGALGGFRWTGQARQPWYNLSGEGTTVPAKNFRAFATPDYVTPANGPSWSATGISATPLGWRGSDGNPMTPLAVTVASDTIRGATVGCFQNAANNYALGAPDASVIPCYVTTTGTLPSPLSASTIYFGLVFGTGAPPFSYQNIFIYQNSQCGGSSLLNLSGGSGTHTIHPIPCLAQFCRLPFRDDNGRMLFFQGGGSIAAETTLRCGFDRTYWQKTGLIESRDLTQASIPNGGAIGETLFNQQWHPHSISSCEQDQDGATGVVQCIGWFPNDIGLDFYNQSLRSERATRCMANAGCGIPYDFLDATTNSRVNLSNTTYTGLPASVATTVSWGFFTGGFTTPPTAGFGMGFTSVGSPEHQPNYAGWALLRFGELDYLDLVVDLGLGDILGADDSGRNTDFPVSGRRGLSFAYKQEYRAIAWGARATQFAAAFAPFDTGTGLDLDGTKTSQQIRDLAALNWQQVQDAMNASNSYFGAATAYMTGRQLWAPKNDRGVTEANYYLTNSPEWEFAYTAGAACLAAMLGDANAQSYIENQIAGRWDYVRTHFTLWDLPGYYETWGTIDSTAGVPHTGITCFSRDQDWNVQNNYTALSWVPGTTAAFTASGFANAQVPANGDQIIFYSRFQPLPGGLSDVTGYYLVSVSYNAGTNTATFGVSTTKGGSAITITNSGGPTNSGNSPGITSSNASMTTDWANHNVPFAVDLDGMYPIIEASRWGKAVLSKLGIYTNQFDGCLTDFNFRLANTSGASLSMVRTLGGGLTDVRYAVADHFG